MKVARKLKYEKGDLIVSKYNRGVVYEVDKHIGYGEYKCKLFTFLRERQMFDLDVGKTVYLFSYGTEKCGGPIDDDLIWE